jgi:hypothetical protein
MTTAPLSASRWTVQKFTSYEDQRRWQVREWQQRGEAARLAAAWDLVVEAWQLQNRPPDELRLQRSVARIVRP